eukprot:730468_1
MKILKKNEFIMEYVGEIINENEYKRRMKEDYKGQSRLCMMRMGQDVIDAKQKGSKARFMNHSCSPNCNVVQWTIDKEHVLGIFAIQSIKKDEELTFDYRNNHCGSLSKNHQVSKSPQHGSGEVSSIEEDEDDDLTDWTAYHQKQKKTKMNKTDALQRNHALKMPRRRNGLILSAVKPSKEKSKKKKKNAKKNVEAKNASENEENTTHNADVEECDVVKDGSDLICKGLFKFKSSQYNYIMATKNAAKRSKLSYNLGIFKDIKPDEIDNEHTNFNTFELRKYCRNGSDGIPVSIRIANTNQFWWYDQTQRIKIKNGEYKFQAYYTGKGGKYISLRHEDQKYIAVTKNGRLTAGRKGIIFKFELIEVQSCEMEVQVQTKLTQYYPQKDNGNQNTQSENATNMDDDEETSPYAYPVCDESLDDALEQLVIMENDYQSSYPEYNVEDIVQSPTDDAVNSEAEVRVVIKTEPVEHPLPHVPNGLECVLTKHMRSYQDFWRMRPPSHRCDKIRFHDDPILQPVLLRKENVGTLCNMSCVGNQNETKLFGSMLKESACFARDECENGDGSNLVEEFIEVKQKANGEMYPLRPVQIECIALKYLPEFQDHLTSVFKVAKDCNKESAIVEEEERIVYDEEKNIQINTEEMPQVDNERTCVGEMMPKENEVSDYLDLIYKEVGQGEEQSMFNNQQSNVAIEPEYSEQTMEEFLAELIEIYSKHNDFVH